MQKRHEYIWCLIELSNGNKEWYCLSKVLRRALFIEKKHNQFWKKAMIGNYITVARSKYIRGRARLTVGRIEKIRIRKKWCSRLALEPKSIYYSRTLTGP